MSFAGEFTVLLKVAFVAPTGFTLYSLTVAVVMVVDVVVGMGNT